MDKKATEILAVSALRDSIVVCDYLQPYIQENDKEPCWDGHIDVYNKKEKKKENLRGRVPLQVKGTIRSDFSKKEVAFPVAIVDLKNYLKDGGAIFFVVYISENGQTKKIYYACLPPIKLRILLKKKNAKTQNIMMCEFPHDNNAKANILFNCLDNCKKQASFITTKLFTPEELTSQGVLTGLCIPVSGVNGQDPLSLLLTNEVYLYAKIKGSTVPQPIELIPQNIQTTENIEIPVRTGDQCFYNSIEVIRTAEETKIKIGESLTIAPQDNGTYTYNYSNSDNFRTLAKDLDFIISAMANGNIFIGNATIPFNPLDAELSDFNIDKNKTLLEYCKKIVQALDTLNYNQDFSISQLTPTDWNHIRMLVTAFVDNDVIRDIPKQTNGLYALEVQGVKFALIFAKSLKEEKACTLSDFFRTELQVAYKDDSGNYNPTSRFIALKASDYMSLGNTSYDAILASYKKYADDPIVLDQANYTLLEMLLAYDKQGRKNQPLIHGAESMAQWLLQESHSGEDLYQIRVLNYLQTVLRQRALTIEEVSLLLEIVETTDDKFVRIGGYWLLDNQTYARIHFNKLSNEEQETFKKFPIYAFCKEVTQLPEKTM